MAEWEATITEAKDGFFVNATVKEPGVTCYFSPFLRVDSREEAETVAVALLDHLKDTQPDRNMPMSSFSGKGLIVVEQFAESHGFQWYNSTRWKRP